MRRWAVALSLATLLAVSSVASGQNDPQAAAPEANGVTASDAGASEGVPASGPLPFGFLQDDDDPGGQGGDLTADDVGDDDDDDDEEAAGSAFLFAPAPAPAVEALPAAAPSPAPAAAAPLAASPAPASPAPAPTAAPSAAPSAAPTLPPTANPLLSPARAPSPAPVRPPPPVPSPGAPAPGPGPAPAPGTSPAPLLSPGLSPGPGPGASPTPSPDFSPSPQPESPSPSPGDFNVTEESPVPAGSPPPGNPLASPSPIAPTPAAPAPAPSGVQPAPAPQPAAAPSPPPPPPSVNAQASALLDFKAGLSSDSQQVLSSWSDVTANPCTATPAWLGVACDQAGAAVTQLQLSNQGLAGPLSDSLGSLPGLQLVDLSQNKLSGTLPAAWRAAPQGGEPAALTSLRLDSNSLNGTLPDLALPALVNATFQNNALTGSIPSSWASLPANASVAVLPQADGLCGAVPDRPALALEAQPGDFYPLVNSLGSCLTASCNPETRSLDGTNLFDVSWNAGAAVWDVAAANPNAEGGGGPVTLPCYAPDSGSPAGDYLGGDMAYFMNAWGNAAPPASPGSVVSVEPGSGNSDCPAQRQGSWWAVDLRQSLGLAAVVVRAGPGGGISDVTVSVSDSLPDPLAPAGDAACASISALQSTSTAVPCVAQGRYLTLTSSTDMFLCRVSVYPQAASTALNKYVYATAADGSTASTVNDGSALTAESPNGSGRPQLVLDIGNVAGVAVVSFSGMAADIDNVSVEATNPLLEAAAAVPPTSRRLLQSPSPAAAPAPGVCNVGGSSGGTVTYECQGASGQFVAITGNPGSNLQLSNVAVYLTVPPTGPLSPPPGPSPPSPPPTPYNTLWVADLLIGGNIGTFIDAEPYTSTLLDAYNAAWSTALRNAGYAMNTAASAFNPNGGLQQNVSNVNGAPYFYPGDAAGQPNLYTNVTVAVDARLDLPTLFALLNTSAVAQDILEGISGSWQPDTIWMVPATAPPPPPSPSSGGLSTGAIAGIAAGGGVAVLAVAATIFCCWRRGGAASRHGSGLSKGSMDLEEEGDHVEAGAYSKQSAAGPSDLEEAQKLYAAQQPGGALLYGSAFTANGTGSGGNPAGLAAVATRGSHSRNASVESSGVLAGTVHSSDTTPRRQGSDDPLLEWILKTQSPPAEAGTGSKAQAAADAVALAAAAADVSASDASGTADSLARSSGSAGGGGAASAGALATLPAGGGAAPPRGTPRHRSVPSKQLDVRVWQFNFRDLEIQKQIGEGSFGRVYLAKWRETLVAVKILMNTGVDIEDADDAERALTLSNPVLESLEKEASMMAALRHPNVVAFLGVCASPPCVATEYCGRGSLTDVLRGGKNSAVKARQLDWARRLNMALDAAKGMLYLHAHVPPIIHRDLKSPNLLVDKHWRVKVSDFNLSKLMEENSVMSSMAATNPRWLAPEILAGSSASYASDVYAYGVVLWELLTWELPWGTTNPWQVVTFVTEGGRLELPPRERLPGPDSQTWGELDAFNRLIKRCWAHSPLDRPGFQEIIAELRDMLERTLAAKGALGGGGEGTAPPARAPSDAAAAAAASSQVASGGRQARGSSLAAPAETPTTPQAGVSRTISDAGTPMSQATGYSSMAAEVGSLDARVLNSAAFQQSR